MFESVNLERELSKIKDQEAREGQGVLDRFRELFQTDWEREVEIAHTARQCHFGSTPIAVSESLSTERIFELRDIEKLALRYRLRFLPTKYFSGELPQEALHRVRSLESKLGVTIENFYLLAPSKVFKLGDANVDPLLFTQMADGRFYLIHKWGSDLAWYRRLSALPLQNPGFLIASVFLVSLLLALITPVEFFREGAAYFGWERALLIVWNNIFLAGVVSFIWFAGHNQFSSQAWKSKYFN